MDAIRETCPDLCSHLDWFDLTSEAHFYTMMIARKPYFDAYMSRLFTLLDWMEPRNELSTDTYQRRVPAFIAERFFSFYLHATGARICEFPLQC